MINTLKGYIFIHIYCFDITLKKLLFLEFFKEITDKTNTKLQIWWLNAILF